MDDKFDDCAKFGRWEKGNLFYTIKKGLSTYEFPIKPRLGQIFAQIEPFNKIQSYLARAIQNKTILTISQSFEYTVKCRDCSRHYKCVSSKEISEEKLEEGGICNLCMEDYK